MRTSQTPASTRAWHTVAAALASVPNQLPGARTASSPGRSAATPGRSSSTVARTGSKARASRSGLAVEQRQLGAARLGVAAPVAAAHALGAGGAVADLDDVGREHGGGRARRLLLPRRARPPPTSRGTRPPAPSPAASRRERLGRSGAEPRRAPGPRPARPARPEVGALRRAVHRGARRGGPGGCSSRPVPAPGPVHRDVLDADPGLDPGPLAPHDEHRGAGAQPGVEHARRRGRRRAAGGRSTTTRSTSTRAAVTSSQCSPGSGTSTVRDSSMPSSAAASAPKSGQPAKPTHSPACEAPAAIARASDAESTP